MSEGGIVELRFLSGTAGTKSLEVEIASTFRELADPESDAGRAAIEAGLNPADVLGAHVSVTKDAKGFGAVEVVVAIAVPVGTRIIDKFWDDVIGPRITDALGPSALGNRSE